MKILIVRMWAEEMDISNYNCQEIGLAKALIRKGNQCDIVLYSHDKKKQQDIYFENNKRIHIYYLTAKRFFKNCIYEKGLYDIVKKYDIIQTSEYDQIANVKLRKLLGDKLVIYHGPYESEFTKGYRKKCMISDLYYLFHKDYKKTKVIAKSLLAMDFLKKKGFKNIKTIGVGIDQQSLEIKNHINNRIDNKLDDFKPKFKLLYIGKIEERRNTLFLIELLKNLVDNGQDIGLILIGKGKNYQKKVLNKIKEYKLENNILYKENLEQKYLKDIYKNCDVFLLPTQYEIFGMVLLEAILFNLPIITTVNGGSSMLVKDRINGFICENNDLKKWMEIINEIYFKTVDIKKTGVDYNKKIISEYTWDNLSSKFLEVYK